jgi:YD repeat-containing protein
MVRRTLPDNLGEEMTYDDAGTLRSRKDFAGRVTAFEYNQANRLIRVTRPDASTVSFTHTPTGRRKTVTDSRGTTLWSYDARDRVQELTYPDGRRLTYAYDASGSRTELTAHMAGQVLTTRFTYDALGRLDQVIDPRGRVYDHGYDANGNRTELLYPNGIETTYVYDGLNRLKELATRRTPVGEVLQSYVYTLGPAGNRIRTDEHDGTSRSYGYDALYRLVGETVAGGTGPVYEKTFKYDPAGNRLRQSHATAEETWTEDAIYDTRDRLVAFDGNSWSWDANGNLTGKTGEASYTWDSGIA